MRHFIIFLILLVSISACRKASVPDPAIGRMGRTLVTADGNIELIGSAALVEFRFRGDTCTIVLSSVAGSGDHNMVALELDGEYAGRRKVTGPEQQRFTVKAESEGDWHTLRIYKATEASNGVVVFHRAEAASLSKVEEQRGFRVEFIGNSITAAMGADTTDLPCGRGSKWYDQHNAWWSYAAITARNVKAEFMLSAISGAGIYRNWNSDGPTVPQQYRSAYLRIDSTRAWDFTAWQPDVVTIALGTNDMSPGDRTKPRDPFDSARFVGTYVEFVRSVASGYPNTQVVLLTSPMMSGTRAATLYRCLQAVRQQCLNDKVTRIPLKIFEFREMKATGCTGHPLIPEHQEMARQLTPFLEMLKSELAPDF